MLFFDPNKQLQLLYTFLPTYYRDYINRDNKNPKRSNKSINNAIKSKGNNRHYKLQLRLQWLPTHLHHETHKVAPVVPLGPAEVEIT